MTGYEAPDPDFAGKVEDRVPSIPAARLYGLRFAALAPGEAELVQPYGEELDGGGDFQGGVIGALADFAGGSAAATLPAGWLCVTAGYTVKIVSPGKGDRLVARGRDVRPGRSLTVAAAEVFAVEDGEESLCATALVTMGNIRQAGAR